MRVPVNAVSARENSKRHVQHFVCQRQAGNQTDVLNSLGSKQMCHVAASKPTNHEMLTAVTANLFALRCLDAAHALGTKCVDITGLPCLQVLKTLLYATVSLVPKTDWRYVSTVP